MMGMVKWLKKALGMDNKDEVTKVPLIVDGRQRSYTVVRASREAPKSDVYSSSMYSGHANVGSSFIGGICTGAVASSCFDSSDSDSGGCD